MGTLGRFQENIDCFLRREPISFQLLQRHEAGQSEGDEHALRCPAAANRCARLPSQNPVARG